MRTRIAIAAVAAALVAAGVAALSDAAVRTSQSGWTWGSPTPQGHTLSAVSFAGPRGYAVGGFGTIVRTDDGGGSWSGVRSAITQNLSRVQTLDANTFVAAGGCTLLRSDNGGDKISELRFSASSSCSSPLAAFHFASKDVGYLVRQDGTVLRTDDGGQRFASRAPLPGNAGPLNDVWFTSPDNGVAVTGADVAGKVFRTTDGGGSWNEVASARGLISVVFVSPTVGYAVGDNVVLKTTDGGGTWDPQPTPGAILTRVSCADDQHCVVTVAGGGLQYTDDGFATLHASARTGGAKGPVPGNAVGYASATRAVAVGDAGVTSISDDAGKVFAQVGGAVNGTFNHLRATSASVAYAPGASGAIAKTTDGGASWSAVGAPTTSGIADVAFPGADLGYAIDDQGSLFRTDNGGGSWQILGQPGSSNTAALWASPGGGTVMIVRSRGILRSTDAGQHFAAVAGKLVSKSRFTDVDRAGNGVIAYGTKVILASTDGGQRWRKVKRPGRKSLIQVDFLDQKTGYALTSDGRVWRTQTGGRKWSESLSTGNSGAFALSFGDGRSGWIAVHDFAGTGGGRGWVLRTSDAGASWRPQLIDDQGLSIGGLAATGGSSGFAFTGRFFATQSGGDAALPSTLSLRAKPGRVGRHGGKVKVTGRLAPAAAGATVSVLARDVKGGHWRAVQVTTDGSGAFTTSWTVKRPALFVAQWAGSQSANATGSRAVTVKAGGK